jgi:hypothetical protein
MAAVARLVTLVDADDDPAGAIGLSARHEAVLVDGRRVLLLDDRGWSWGPPRPYGGASVGDASVGDAQGGLSVEDIEKTARMVVGPDEPFEGGSQADAEAAHWAHLTEILRQEGVSVDPAELRRLPHDVVLGERLLARVGRDPGDAA